jgi:hypothetical protein
MSNWVVVVKWGTGGLRGETEKEQGELVIPIAEELKGGCREKSVGAMAVPGLGSLKLVKTAWGIPGAPAEPPPNSMTLFFGGLPRFLLNMVSMLVVMVIITGSGSRLAFMFHFFVYSWIL